MTFLGWIIFDSEDCFALNSVGSHASSTTDSGVEQNDILWLQYERPGTEGSFSQRLHAKGSELLNEMDGLSDDVDVLFVLTTNRPEILEPALAARPGRIDQAYEVPLPDAECRKRLFDSYSNGLTMRVENMDVFIKRTAGASGAFINELMRKAAIFAAPDGDPIVVKDAHIDEAMHEMVVVGGNLTKSLLGSRDIGFIPNE